MDAWTGLGLDAHLNEVADGGGAEAGEEGAGALVRDGVPHAGEQGHALVGGADLYSRLDHVNGYVNGQYRRLVVLSSTHGSCRRASRWSCAISSTNGAICLAITYVQHIAPACKGAHQKLIALSAESTTNAPARKNDE